MPVTQNIAPVTINFTDTSSGDSLSYLWNFGDNNEYGNVSGTHSYEKPGKYIVTLKISSPE